VCAKTGTVGTKDGNSDVYCLAYSPAYTVGVWVGNCAKKMPNSVTAGGVACRIAEKVFGTLNDDSEISKPDGVKCRYIDINMLKQNHVVLLAGEDVSLKDKSCEWFSEKNMPKDFSTPQYGGYLDYDELLNFDFDNFEIIEDLFY
jgi:membrane peptidoglycan carboxypeptidase